MPKRPKPPWKCPACLRDVPWRIETCYCGFQRSDVPASAPARDPRARGFALSALAVAAVGALIAYFTLFRERPPEPRAQATPAPPGTLAARRSPASRQTPYATASNPAPTSASGRPAIAVPSFPPGLPTPAADPTPSPDESLDGVREKAAQALDRSLEQLVPRVENFRADLRHFQNGCRSGGGPWPPSGCDSIREDLRQRLEQIRTSIESAEEQARRASVYPGVRAEIRRRHGLDDDAWNALQRLARDTLE